jgi:hypothetical protein
MHNLCIGCFDYNLEQNARYIYYKITLKLFTLCIVLINIVDLLHQPNAH